ncbi:hypothetical protein [Actinomadura sp. WMMA1423]|uniref:hypothetical protein n=1 Tax=Actinomadura sp. WMMA1423 TaxID=2591108 RepID=UPI0011462F40|nr:hypothetical protein [Actinomadura sp. WMMA1423]
MRKIAAAAATAGSTAAVGLLLSATAHASTVVVTGGGPVTLAASTGIVVTDPVNGRTITCPTSTGSGDVPNGTALAEVGSIGAIRFSLCAGSGFNFALTPKISNLARWKIKVTGLTSGGRTPGVLTGVSMHASAAGGLCQADLDGPGGAGSSTGQSEVGYDNATGELALTGSTNLRFHNVTAGCLGFVSTGHPASLGGTYVVTNGQGAHPQITSA